MFVVEEAGDDRVDDEVHGQGDERVELEESRHKGRCCCSEHDVGDKEQESFQGDNYGGRDLTVFVVISRIEVCEEKAFCRGVGHR